jgi:hypothetical protein
LQEIQVRGDLNLDQIRRLDDFAELTEIDAFRVCAVGHEMDPRELETDETDEKSGGAGVCVAVY